MERNKAEAIVDKFSVQSDLLKLMKTSPNISKARSLDGIIEIEIRDEESEVIIYGENGEIVNTARELIEFEEKNYVVPRSLGTLTVNSSISYEPYDPKNDPNDLKKTQMTQFHHKLTILFSQQNYWTKGKTDSRNH